MKIGFVCYSRAGTEQKNASGYHQQIAHLAENVRHDEILGAASTAEDPGPGRLVQLVEGLVGGHEEGEVPGPGQQLAQLRGLQRGHHGLEVEVGGENLGDGVHGRHQHAVHHVHHAVGRGVVPGEE